MTLRREPTYLSSEVWRALLILAKAHSDETRHLTADQMADDLLREYMHEKYPQLFKHQKEVDKLECALIKSLPLSGKSSPESKGGKS